MTKPRKRRKGEPTKLSVKKVVNALRKSHGMIAIAARELGCSRKVIYNYIKKYPEVAEVIEEAREYTTDTAETKLYESIKNREPWAVQFYLKTQGKRRGYVEKQEVDNRHSFDGVVGIQVNMPEPDADS